MASEQRSLVLTSLEKSYFSSKLIFMQAYVLGTLLTSGPEPGRAAIPSFSLWLVWEKEGQT